MDPGIEALRTGAYFSDVYTVSYYRIYRDATTE